MAGPDRTRLVTGTHAALLDDPELPRGLVERTVEAMLDAEMTTLFQRA